MRSWVSTSSGNMRDMFGKEGTGDEYARVNMHRYEVYLGSRRLALSKFIYMEALHFQQQCGCCGAPFPVQYQSDGWLSEGCIWYWTWAPSTAYTRVTIYLPWIFHRQAHDLAPESIVRATLFYPTKICDSVFDAKDGKRSKKKVKLMTKWYFQFLPTYTLTA